MSPTRSGVAGWGPAACALLLAAAWPGAGAASHAVRALAPLPPGITLPVKLRQTLDARHASPGTPVTATLIQRVPLPDGDYLPGSAELLGTVLRGDGGTLELQFATLRLREAAEPVRLELLAAANWLDVIATHDPLGGSGGHGSSSDWTTMQVGRDEIYYGGWAGPVYNQYSEPVGRADGTGVYAAPAAPGGLERAMGPFSTTSAGLYDLPGLALDPGRAGTVVLQTTSPGWKLRAGTALLLQVPGP